MLDAGLPASLEGQVGMCACTAAAQEATVHQVHLQWGLWLHAGLHRAAGREAQFPPSSLLLVAAGLLWREEVGGI